MIFYELKKSISYKKFERIKTKAKFGMVFFLLTIPLLFISLAIIS